MLRASHETHTCCLQEKLWASSQTCRDVQSRAAFTTTPSATLIICQTRGTAPTYHTGWLRFVEDRVRQLAYVAHTEPGMNRCSVLVESFLLTWATRIEEAFEAWWGEATQKGEPTKDTDSGSWPINAGISKPRLSLLNRFCREKNIKGRQEMKNKQSKTNTHLSKTSLLSRRGRCLCPRSHRLQLQREVTGKRRALFPRFYRTGRKTRRISGEDSGKGRRQRKIKTSGSSRRCALFLFVCQCLPIIRSYSTSAQKFGGPAKPIIGPRSRAAVNCGACSALHKAGGESGDWNVIYSSFCSSGSQPS